ncbi:MAG: response regulator transcription factor [Actinomycetota bacterium]|nr:response regulator transcription factor [Actinomycetota bacterium]
MTVEGPAAPTRVMLVDDHRDFRDLMVALLGSQPDLEVVTQAGSMAEARAEAATSRFDVVVLDLGLPDGNGADLIGELREASPGGAVLIMSASLHPTNIERAMRAGADEVLDKLSPPAEVVGTVRRLGAGGPQTDGGE